jgi:regulator of protease activity HflC (stomatin/prohibitin superfamily)
MGVKITFVGLESVHPPIQVAEAFEKVVGALQEKQAKVLEAQGQAQEILAKAGGESEVLQFNAQGYAFERSEVARADAERFAHQIEAHQKGGQVYLWREYLSVMDQMLPAMRKYVINSDNVNSWIYELDLKEKLQPDLFDLGLEEPKQEIGK